MKKKTYVLIFTLLAAATILSGYNMKVKAEDTMRIRLIFEDKTLTATMRNSPTAIDFMSLLPLTLTLKDYAGTEKVSGLPKKLSLEQAPSGYKPTTGDLTLYAPWGNLAIFYRDFSYADGLVPLGTLDGDVQYLSTLKDNTSVRIELIAQ